MRVQLSENINADEWATSTNKWNRLKEFLQNYFTKETKMGRDVWINIELNTVPDE